jgi:hypothetical protein
MQRTLDNFNWQVNFQLTIELSHNQRSYLKEDALLISECLPQIMETLAERLLPVDPRQSADSLGNNFGTSSSDLLGVYSNTSLAIEPAEELRLQLVSVLAESINALGRQCAEREQFVELILPFMDRLNRIISATLCDSFHEVKKESCRVLTALGQLASRAVGMLSLDRLSASLFSIIFHKHSAVRTAAVQVISVLNIDPEEAAQFSL